MTTEQQILFDMARSHTHLAGERLAETNVPFALSHLKEAQRALESFQAATPRALAAHTQPIIEVTATKQS